MSDPADDDETDDDELNEWLEHDGPYDTWKEYRLDHD